jgi:hypothetical protein
MSNDLTTMRLSHGAHGTREAGVCLLEAVEALTAALEALAGGEG